MVVISRLVGRLAKLPPTETYDVLVERDLKMPMPDGVVLLADRYAPRGADRLPAILVRSCYGRRGFFGFIYGYLFAERGYQVVIQSTRDHYRYDPTNPTPSVAGPLLRGKAMPADNRQLEARPDVLTYTTTPLEHDLDVIGIERGTSLSRRTLAKRA